MIGKTNIGNGSSLSFRGALLCIIAPTGSTITLIKNNLIIKTLYPKDQHIFKDGTEAYWYYSVSPSNYGSWTITATLGTDTTSDTVVVNDNKQYDLALDYYTYIYKRGYINTTLTGGLTHSGYAYGSYTIKSATYNLNNIYIVDGSCAGTSQAIDLTNYNTIYFVVRPASQSNPTHPWLGIATTKNLYANQVLFLGPNSYTESTLSADISSLTGNYYIGTMSSSSNAYGYVYEIYLK